MIYNRTTSWPIAWCVPYPERGNKEGTDALAMIYRAVCSATDHLLPHIS